MLTVPRPARLWFRIHAHWALPALTLGLVYLLAPHVPPQARVWLTGAALFDLTVTAALIVWQTTPARQRHAAQLVLTLGRGLLVAWLLLPLAREWWWAPALLAAGTLALIAHGLTRPLPRDYGDLDDVEARVAWWDRIAPEAGLGRFLAAETAVWSALWRRPVVRGPRFQAASGAGTEFVLLIFLSVMEAVPVHFLLAQRSPEAAKVHLLVNALGVLWCAAQLRALRTRPVEVGARRLYLRAGLLWSGSVALDAVRVAPEAEPEGAFRPVRTLTPNVALTFAVPVTLYGLGGQVRVVEAVALRLDDRPGFLAALDAAQGTHPA